MNLELAVSTYSLLRWRKENGKTLEDTLHWLAGQQVRGVEFSGLDERTFDRPLERARELKKCCDDLGLRAVNYCVGAELLADPRAQREVITRVKQAVDVAAILAAGRMRHDVTFGPKEEPPRSWPQVLEVVGPAVREISAYARARGIRSSLENHGFYLQTADRVEKLIQAVGDSNFGLTLDLGNFLCLNQDPVAATRQLVPYAVHVHVKDFHVRPKERKPPSGWFDTPTPLALRGAIVGHGVIDIPAQLKILKQAGYKGWLSLEFEGLEEPTRAVQLGLEYLRGQLAGG